MQLKINGYKLIFEWIPYSQFDNIKEISKDSFTTIYSAIWKDGPLYYCFYENEYERRAGNKKVSLKCFNSQYLTDDFFNEVSKEFLYKFIFFLSFNNIFFYF